MKPFSHKKGFTILELLVVICIITIVTIVVFANYRAGERQYALQRSANKLARDIRRAQEMAMSATKCEICPSKDVPVGGYGIYLSNADDWERKYILYADEGNQRYGSGDTVIEEMYLERGVYFKERIPPKMSINFKPPDPVVSLKDEAGADSVNVTIKIALESDTAKTKTITVNKAGRIEVD